MLEFDVLVEIPKGERNKYEVDHESGRMRLDRMLFTSTQYPADYGYIEDTLGQDGDPLDALVLLQAPTFPGCLIKCRAIGMFRMTDEAGGDDKVLCVPAADPRQEHLRDINHLPKFDRLEIQHFFEVYKDLEPGKSVEGADWVGRADAEAEVMASFERAKGDGLQARVMARGGRVRRPREFHRFSGETPASVMKVHAEAGVLSLAPGLTGVSGYPRVVHSQARVRVVHNGARPDPHRRVLRAASVVAMTTSISPVSHLCDPHGVLLRREAVEPGIDDNALASPRAGAPPGPDAPRDLLRQRDLQVRRRPGATPPPVARGHAAVRRATSRCPTAVPASPRADPSAGLDLRSVNITHLSGGGRQQSRIRHHSGRSCVSDLRRQDGHWVSAPARAVLETACTDGTAAGLVQANHFLHAGLMTTEHPDQGVRASESWPGSLSHHVVIHLASSKIESVGESRSPTSCSSSRGCRGRRSSSRSSTRRALLAARVDFAWPEFKVIVEFDGEEKYHRFRRKPARPSSRW